MGKKLLLIILWWIAVGAAFPGWAEGQGPHRSSSGVEKATSGVNTPPPAMVMIYNRPIVAFRDTVFGSSPQQRARNTEERVHALIDSSLIGPVSFRRWPWTHPWGPQETGARTRLP
jgi:hypothetical protein